MKPWIVLILSLAAFWAKATPAQTNSSATNRVFIIQRSITAVSGGKATLIIGPLHRTTNVYEGDYQMKVSPYFFKNEKGRLSIVVSDESLKKIGTGKVAEITGTATTNGKGGKSRRIDATATPSDKASGTLKLWFISEDRKMTFNTSYRFGDK